MEKPKQTAPKTPPPQNLATALALLKAQQARPKVGLNDNRPGKISVPQTLLDAAKKVAQRRPL